MKKSLKFYCLLLSILISITTRVNAAVNVSSYGSAGFFGGEEVVQAKLSLNGTDTTAYCHNPGILAFTKAEAGNHITLIQKRKLGDSANGRSQNIYDAGLMAILTSGNDNGTQDFSMAKYIAINLYEQLFPMFNSNANNSSSEISYLKYLINTRLYDSIKGDLKTLASKMGAYNVISGKMSGASNCSGDTCGSQSTIDSAISLVKTAVKKAVDYANNGEATVAISNGIQKRIINTDDNGKKTYKNTVNHTITIQNFGETNGTPRSVYLRYNCANCQNVTAKFYLNDQELTKDLSSINLLDYTNNGSGTVTLKIEFTGTVCQDINYTLSADYTHYTVTKSGYSVAKCSNSNKCQGFYMVDSNTASGTKTTSIENKLSLCQTPGETSSCTAKIDNVECIECRANEHNIDIVEGYEYANDNTCDTSGATLNIKKCIANDGAVDSAAHTYKNSDLSSSTVSHNAGVYCKEDYHLKMPGSILADTGRYFILKSAIEGTETCYTNDLMNSKNIASVKSEIAAHGADTVNAWNQIQYNKAIAACVSDPSCYTIDEEKKLIKSLHVQKSRPLNGTTITELNGLCGEGNSNGKCFTISGQWYYRYWTTINFYDIRPVIYINTSYTARNTRNCGTTTVSVNEAKYGDWLGRSWSESVANSYDCSENDVCDVAVEHLTSAEISAALAKIGKQATGHWVGSGGSVGSKVTGGGSWVGEAGSGLSVHLGTGSVISDINDWNNATGYNAGVYNNDFDDTPFDQGWKMNYNFDPQMYFWYQEEYMNKAKTDQMDMYDKSLQEMTAQYCTGEVQDNYTCTTGWQDSPSVEGGSVCVCWGPDAGDCANKSYVLSNVRYVKQSQNAEAKFITPTQFYSIHPSGSVVVADPGKENEIPNSKELTNGLPVGLGSNGTGRYVLWIEKLGEYFDKDDLGRVWGQSDSVISKLLQDRTKCNTENSALVDEDNTQGVIHDEGVYACKYSTDCPQTCKKPDESSDGKYHCKDGEVCEEEDYNRECCPTCPVTVVYKCAVTTNEEGELVYYDKDGNETDKATYKSQCCPNGDCPVTCAFCLYDGNKLNVQYRPITSEDLNPNNRDLGKNWSWEEPIDTALELKAYVTTNEINEKGDTIYDISDSSFDRPSVDNEYAVQVTMNGRMISKIRDYNRDNKDQGFANNTMECYDLKDGETVHKNVYCYSTFIDYLLEDSKIAENIKFTRERPTGNDRKNSDNNEKYFTSWLKADLSNWNVTTEKELAYYKEHYGMEINYDNDTTIDYHVGPSWR